MSAVPDEITTQLQFCQRFIESHCAAFCTYRQHIGLRLAFAVFETFCKLLAVVSFLHFGRMQVEGL